MSRKCCGHPSNRFKARSIRRRHRCFERARSLSQILRIVQPFVLNSRLTKRSLFLFCSNFVNQKRRLVTGRPRFPLPCQKSPSTKMASFFRGKAKSGRPIMGTCRRQPVIPASRNSISSFTSVVAFPRDLTFRMTSLRLSLVQISAITPTPDGDGYGSLIREPAKARG